MKASNTGKLVNKFFQMKFVYFLLLLIVIFAVVLIPYKNEEYCDVKINYKLDEEKSSLKHNYILFLDRSGNSHGKIVEKNGWLLLEALLERVLHGNVSPALEEELKIFNNEKLYGWWPEETLKEGKEYFVGKENIKLSYDVGDTAMVYKYHNDLIGEGLIQNFLSDKPLPSEFQEVCKKVSCDSHLILRTWSHPDWYDDIDIVANGDFITTLNLSSDFSKSIFEANRNLINYIIKNEDIDNYFKYFEPKVSGYFFLLMPDDEGPQFLSNKSRGILLKKLKEKFDEINQTPIVSRWGGGNDWFYGCNIATMNERIPKLMLEYAKTHWAIEESLIY